MKDNLGVSVIIGAAILGVAILGGALMIRSSLDQGTDELAGVRAALGDFKEALSAAARPMPQRPQRARGPDPSKRYNLATDGDPARGVQTAKVTIVEFSDFQ
jgi:hypothetical protein